MLTNNYSGTKCPKCENSSFEVVIDTPKNSTVKMRYLRCSNCSTLITALEFHAIGDLIKRLAKGLNIDLEKIKL